MIDSPRDDSKLPTPLANGARNYIVVLGSSILPRGALTNGCTISERIVMVIELRKNRFSDRTWAFTMDSDPDDRIVFVALGRNRYEVFGARSGEIVAMPMDY